MAIGDRVLKYSIILKTILLKVIFTLKSVCFDSLYVLFAQLLNIDSNRKYLLYLNAVKKQLLSFDSY